MDKKILIMGGIAVAFGGLSVFAADIWLKSNVKTEIVEVPVAPETARGQTFATLVVAAEQLSYGDRITAGSLTEIPWPDDRIPVGGFTTIDEAVADGVRASLGTIEVNEPILSSKITGPDSRPTLSNKLEDGMRAVAVEVDEVSAVAGFIVPGDRVDVAVTTKLGDGESLDASNIVTSVVLENIKVLTVGQNIDEGDIEPIISRSVTLEVDHVQARKLNSAKRTGSLSLFLRKAGEVENPVEIDFNPTAAYERSEDIEIAPDPTVTIAVRHGSRLQAVDVKKEAR